MSFNFFLALLEYQLYYTHNFLNGQFLKLLGFGKNCLTYTHLINIEYD
jgi:hypothetical protein